MPRQSPVSRVIAKNIDSMLGKNPKSNARVAEFIGCRPDQVRSWRLGDRVPHIDTVEKIARFLQVPMSHLLKRG